MNDLNQKYTVIAAVSSDAMEFSVEELSIVDLDDRLELAVVAGRCTISSED